MAIVAKSVGVTGRVQGVFFRAWTKQQADALGVTGWVRNCPDGRVAAHVEGDEGAVQQFVDRLHRGPPAASIREVHVSEAVVESAHEFVVKH